MVTAFIRKFALNIVEIIGLAVIGTGVMMIHVAAGVVLCGIMTVLWANNTYASTKDEDASPTK